MIEQKQFNNNRRQDSVRAPIQRGHIRTNKAPLHTASSSTEAFVANVNRSKVVNQTAARFSAEKCRYCTKDHYSDECLKYRTIGERKAHIRGSCFRCLREGHMASDCKINRTCVHCGEYNNHHRSLCPKKYGVKPFSETTGVNLSEINEQMKSRKDCSSRKYFDIIR